MHFVASERPSCASGTIRLLAGSPEAAEQAMSGGAVLCYAGLDPRAGAVVQFEEVVVLGDDPNAIASVASGAAYPSPEIRTQTASLATSAFAAICSALMPRRSGVVARAQSTNGSVLAQHQMKVFSGSPVP